MDAAVCPLRLRRSNRAVDRVEIMKQRFAQHRGEQRIRLAADLAPGRFPNQHLVEMARNTHRYFAISRLLAVGRIWMLFEDGHWRISDAAQEILFLTLTE